MPPTSDAPDAAQQPARTSQTHCYIHPERRSVAVCVVCKRGVCRLCSRVSKGRNFCPPDAAMLQRNYQRTSRAQFRRNAITLAAILAFLNGAGVSVVGFLLIIIGLLGPQAQSAYSLTPALQPFFTYFANVLDFPPSQTFGVGLFAFVIGLVDIFAGILLLRRSRIAGIISILVSILGIFVVSTYLVVLAVAGVFAYVHVVTSSLKALLVGLGWKHLDER
ncbi:MAG: hypothetical protein ABSG45_09085 [Nitrososphaerales archaeon]